MFLNIGGLKKFTIFTGNHLCWSLFLIRPAAFLKRDSNTDVSCGYRGISKNSIFYRTPPVAASDSPITV